MTGSDEARDGWEPVSRPRTYELVLDRIEEQIASGRLHVGDRLPAERELAAALGVSRVAVREAIRVLQAMGLISQATGSGRDAGTILTSAPAEALTRLIRLHVLVASVNSKDLVRARITLERESAALAECPGHGKTIFEYQRGGNGAADYRQLADDLATARTV